MDGPYDELSSQPLADVQFECINYVILHDFRYEGGAPINSGSQIPLVNEKREYGTSQQVRTG